MSITISLKDFRKVLLADEGKQRKITQLVEDNDYLQSLVSNGAKTIDNLYVRLSEAQAETERVREGRPIPLPLSELTKPRFDQTQTMLIMEYFCKLPAQTLRNALEQMFPGQKINQIKFVRSFGNIGLKDAKEFVEGVSDNFGFATGK